MSAKKQRTKRFKLRFYLILLVPILLVGAYIGYRILNPTTGRLGSDTVEGDPEFTGVIIRRVLYLDLYSCSVQFHQAQVYQEYEVDEHRQRSD